MAAGRKTGGRQAGTPNTTTLTLREQVEAAAGGKPLPVVLAEVGTKALNAGDMVLACTAFAKAAAYVYPRLQTVQAEVTAAHQLNGGMVPPLVVTDGVGRITGDAVQYWPGPVVIINTEPPAP